ncbi:uncharacterized protein MKK02DRAFT_32492 [Dioszegia hungarica]|uniref:Uncharacterized protein n=1 Tax=Dioszegia hungarica TaxID=4972 RepID=A0AA38HC35_9TREE|nr:uncharacterized protein MKK02DRAFT_32492 [Dioszegia hungarica]KAI9637705.1 hypothetical protein MKK02DRAFT_32492 [Dioszegia hungarica]
MSILSALELPHTHHVSVNEVAKDTGDIRAAHCTFHYIDGTGSTLPMGLEAWVTGAIGNTSSSLDTMLRDQQTKFGDACIVCAIADGSMGQGSLTLRWNLRTPSSDCFRAGDAPSAILDCDCGTHADGHRLEIKSGNFKIADPLPPVSAYKITAIRPKKTGGQPFDTFVSSLLLTRDEDDGWEALFEGSINDLPSATTSCIVDLLHRYPVAYRDIYKPRTSLESATPSRNGSTSSPSSTESKANVVMADRGKVRQSLQTLALPSSLGRRDGLCSPRYQDSTFKDLLAGGKGPGTYGDIWVASLETLTVADLVTVADLLNTRTSPLCSLLNEDDLGGPAGVTSAKRSLRDRTGTLVSLGRELSFVISYLTQAQFWLAGAFGRRQARQFSSVLTRPAFVEGKHRVTRKAQAVEHVIYDISKHSQARRPSAFPLVSQHTTHNVRIPTTMPRQCLCCPRFRRRPACYGRGRPGRHMHVLQDRRRGETSHEPDSVGHWRPRKHSLRPPSHAERGSTDRFQRRGMPPLLPRLRYLPLGSSVAAGEFPTSSRRRAQIYHQSMQHSRRRPPPFLAKRIVPFEQPSPARSRCHNDNRETGVPELATGRLQGDHYPRPEPTAGRS